MNVDTDTQWAYWDGLRLFYKKHEGYLQGQVGNPEGEDKPNKKYYDPRIWIRAAEETMIKRAQESLTILGNETPQMGGLHGREVAFALLTPPTRV